MMSAYFHITFQNMVAVRRELVIDECGGASRRHRQAHA